jgi:DNA invertase Pin-like site-specific DNA recombinase
MNERQLALDLSPRLKGVAYLRTSTPQQLLSIDAQRGEILRWASENAVDILSWHEDVGISGTRPIARRAGIRDALQRLTATSASLLMVTHRDRLARDPSIAAEIDHAVLTAGAEIAYATPTGSEVALMRDLTDAFARYERDCVVSRTKAALSVKRARGERTGGIPLGCTTSADGVQLVADEREAATVARILELRAKGASVRGIAAQLDVEGHRARGGRWHATSVVRVLKRNG